MKEAGLMSHNCGHRYRKQEIPVVLVLGAFEI